MVGAGGRGRLCALWVLWLGDCREGRRPPVGCTCLLLSDLGLHNPPLTHTGGLPAAQRGPVCGQQRCHELRGGSQGGTGAGARPHNCHSAVRWRAPAHEQVPLACLSGRVRVDAGGDGPGPGVCGLMCNLKVCLAAWPGKRGVGGAAAPIKAPARHAAAAHKQARQLPNSCPPPILVHPLPPSPNISRRATGPSSSPIASPLGPSSRLAAPPLRALPSARLRLGGDAGGGTAGTLRCSALQAAHCRAWLSSSGFRRTALRRWQPPAGGWPPAAHPCPPPSGRPPRCQCSWEA